MASGYEDEPDYAGPMPKAWETIALAVTLALVVILCVAATGAWAANNRLDIPDYRLTPGVARTDLTLQQICTTKWGADARHVTAAMKRQVFAEYGLSGNNDPACVGSSPRRRCEIDHLISREIGGADDVKNLWPEPYGTHPWNAAVKDRLENRLHKEVCEGTIPLKQAQHEIATDWRVPYRTYFGEPPN